MEGEIGPLRRVQMSKAREVCGVQVKDGNRAKDLILSSVLIGSVGHDSSYCGGHVLRREYGHFFRETLKFQVEGQTMK